MFSGAGDSGPGKKADRPGQVLSGDPLPSPSGEGCILCSSTTGTSPYLPAGHPK